MVDYNKFGLTISCKGYGFFIAPSSTSQGCAVKTAKTRGFLIRPKCSVGRFYIEKSSKSHSPKCGLGTTLLIILNRMGKTTFGFFPLLGIC